jgi:hypothetical protein
MMTLVHDLSYYHNDELKFAALELPYEVNFSLNLIFDIFKNL